MRYYVSHSIRGAKGAAATPTDMKENCDRILLLAACIRQALPSVELYVPAEHEDFVLKAFLSKYITEKQILDVDCQIIDTCDGVIVFSPPDDMMCGGRTVEYEHAIATGKPVLIFETTSEAISWLTHQMLRA